MSLLIMGKMVLLVHNHWYLRKIGGRSSFIIISFIALHQL